MVGGSVASSIFGEPLSTNDIDLVTDLPAAGVPRFARALGADFSVDEEALADALRRRRSWNIFFEAELTRVDLFALKVTPRITRRPSSAG